MWYSPEQILAAAAISSLTLLSPTTLPYSRDAVAAPSTACDARVPGLPSSIALEKGLEPVVRWTLENSPTFRQQCRILAAAPALTASVRVAMQPAGTTARAMSMVRRMPSGAIDVDIEIRNTTNLMELLGHEFEHVIEQIDGVSLVALESAGKARRLDGGAFETDRAIAAGQRVSGEVLDNSTDRVKGAFAGAWRLFRRLR